MTTTDEPYEFRLPIKLRKTGGGYAITDKSGVDLCYIYGRDDLPASRPHLTEDEAEQVAKAVAKMIRATGFPKY